MNENYRTIEDFILNKEIESFRKYLEIASAPERDIIIKIILLFTNSNMYKANLALNNHDFPTICYLSHDGQIEISAEKNFLKDWFNLIKFYIDLQEYNLPIITGELINDKLKIKITNSTVKWEEIRKFTSYIDNIPFYFTKNAIIRGSINSKDMKILKDLDINSIGAGICFVTPCKDLNEFKTKSELYQIKFHLKHVEKNNVIYLPFNKIKKNKFD